jgi:hypothetical protein
MSEHLISAINELANAFEQASKRDDVYYKLLRKPNGECVVVELQWFDEPDYGEALMPLRFDNEMEARQAAGLANLGTLSAFILFCLARGGD